MVDDITDIIQLEGFLVTQGGGGGDFQARIKIVSFANKSVAKIGENIQNSLYIAFKII